MKRAFSPEKPSWHKDKRRCPRLVPLLAYVSGRTLTDRETGRTIYQKKRGAEVFHAQTILPTGCGLTSRIQAEAEEALRHATVDSRVGWLSFTEEFFWHAMDWNEKHPYGRLGFHLIAPLPKDLPDAETIEVATSFGQFLSDHLGVPCFIGVHRGRGGNPHAHYFLGRRKLNLDEELRDLPADWAERWHGYVPLADRLKGEDLRDLSQPKGLRQFLVDYKEWWYGHLRELLKAKGRHQEAQLIDSRTNEQLYEAGILESHRAPQVHIGQAATQKERRGIKTDRGKFVQDVIEQNKRAAVLSKIVDARLPALPPLPWGRSFPPGFLDLRISPGAQMEEDLSWVDTVDHQSTARALPRAVYADDPGGYAEPGRTKVDLRKLSAFAARSAHTEHQRLLVVPDSRETRLRYYTWLDVACHAEERLCAGERTMAVPRPYSTAVDIAREADKRWESNPLDRMRLADASQHQVTGVAAIVDAAWLRCFLARKGKVDSASSTKSAAKASKLLRQLEDAGAWQLACPVWPVHQDAIAELIAGVETVDSNPIYELRTATDRAGDQSFGKGLTVLRHMSPLSITRSLTAKSSAADDRGFTYQLDRLEFDFRLAAWEAARSDADARAQSQEVSLWNDLACWAKNTRKRTGDTLTTDRKLDPHSIISELDDDESLDWRKPDLLCVPSRLQTGKDPSDKGYRKSAAEPAGIDPLWLCGWLHRRRNALPKTEDSVVTRNFMLHLESLIRWKQPHGVIRVYKQPCTLLDVAEQFGLVFGDKRRREAKAPFLQMEKERVAQRVVEVEL